MDLKSINLGQLQNFLIEKPSPIEEFQLFKNFYPQVPIDLTDYNFFKAHFFIHHGLYELKNQLRQKGYLLFIQLSKVYVLKIPEKGQCSWFSESQISFCGKGAEDRFCAYHQKQNRERIEKGFLESNPLQIYYSNLQNLEELDEDTFRQFTASGIYLADNIMKVQQALRVFSLSPGAEVSKITSRYRYLAKRSHPDGNGDSNYKFQEIKEAYEVLRAWKEPVDGI